MTLFILQKLFLIAPSWVGSFLLVATETVEHGDTAAHAAAAEHSGPPKLPSLVELLFGRESVAEHWVNVIYAFAVGTILSLIALRVYAKRQMIPGKFQNAVEMCVEGMYNFIESILGKDAKKYVPYLGSLFFYILLMNWIGMIPLGHSPSTSLNITASLALLTFLYVQWTGISRLGLGGYLHHLAGSPQDVIGWCMVPLLFPLHIIGELAKPFSLALRLFGNITGEDTLVAVFVGLGIALLAFSPVGVPLQLPFYFLGLLLSTIQALVFTLLSTIYILLMLPHEEHAH